MSPTTNAFGVVHKRAKTPVVVPPPYDGKKVLLGLSAIGAGSYLAGKKVKQGKVSKVETVERLAGNVVPANTIDAYRKSKKRKTEAATLHWGAQTAGNAAGVGAGMAIGGLAARKTGFSRAASKIGPVSISAAKKQKWAEYLAASTGGSAGGLAGGAYMHRKIRNSDRYDYRGKK